MRKILLMCGIFASLTQFAANVIAPIWFVGYDWISQTVSELSAIDSPTRSLWVAMMVPYALSMLAFSLGIWLSAGASRALKLTAILGFLHTVLGFFWPPMHLRGAEFTLTDALHIVWTAFTVPLMMIQVISAAVALGTKFRIYSGLTVAMMIFFGVLTSLEAPNIAANGPTPLIGVWERIGIAAYMIWVPVLAAILMRSNPQRPDPSRTSKSQE